VQQLPRELLQAIDEVLKQQGGKTPRPEEALRLSVALECWLHGSVTTEQAIGVLRSPPPTKRR
jgi:hypothetical protein